MSNHFYMQLHLIIGKILWILPLRNIQYILHKQSANCPHKTISVALQNWQKGDNSKVEQQRGARQIYSRLHLKYHYNCLAAVLTYGS